MFAKVTELLSKQKITIKVDPVFTDPYKQSELHKAARGSRSELAALLSTKTFDINQDDNQGRTALHIAAAVNNLDAVELLLTNNAHIDKKTLGDGQSAIHHAAKHNATRTLLYLCEHGANIQSRDYRLRTPLFLAAEYGHKESAKILLDYGADIKSLDRSGQSILSFMMVNMPTVAEKGLNQLYSYNPDIQKSLYYIKPLEPSYNNILKSECSRRPMQFIVWYKLNNLVRHPVIKKFVDVKWKIYGHMEALTLLAADTVFLVSWCSFLYLFATERSRFTDFRKEIWKFLFALFCFVELIYLIILDIYEYFEMRYLFRLWQQQQQESLEDDLKFCSPALPQEEAFLRKRLEQLIKMKPFYRPIYWRLISWILYVMLLVIFFILTGNVMLRKKVLRNIDRQLVAIIIIPLWLRGLKYFQVLSFIGPFILMLRKIIISVLKYLFIYCEMLIAFTIAFWIIFTEISQHLKTTHSLIFTVLQVTLVHHYGYAELHDTDPLMTYVLVCLLILGSIICKNLLIAMLTKTFSGVQDEISTQITMERLAVLVQRDNSWLFYFDHQAAHYFIYKLCMPLTVLDKDYTAVSFLKGAFMIITKQLHDIEVFLKTRVLDFKGIGGILKRKLNEILRSIDPIQWMTYLGLSYVSNSSCKIPDECRFLDYLCQITKKPFNFITASALNKYRKKEEQNLAIIEHDVNVLQKKLMKMASLREKKNRLLFLQLQLIFCLLERMKTSTESATSKQKD